MVMGDENNITILAINDMVSSIATRFMIKLKILYIIVIISINFCSKKREALYYRAFTSPPFGEDLGGP